MWSGEGLKIGKHELRREEAWLRRGCSEPFLGVHGKVWICGSPLAIAFLSGQVSGSAAERDVRVSEIRRGKL